MEQSRFDMLTTIHEYAYERLLESDESDLIRHHHAEYYRHFVETVEPLIRSAERIRWRHVMHHDFDNIRGVLEWVSTTGNCLEIGQQIIILLGMSWIHSGAITEGRRWCTQIISLSGPSTPVAIRAGLLWIAGLVGWGQGDHAYAQASLDECLELLGRLDSMTQDDKELLGQALFIRGVLAATVRDLKTATVMCQRSLDLFQETKDEWYESLALSFLGDCAYYENDKVHANILHDQSIQVARRQGDPWCLVPSLMSSAQIAVMDGDISKARSILLEAIVLLRNTGDQWSLTWALNELGHVALLEGELDQAGVYLLEGLTLGNALGNRAALIILLAGSAALITRWSKDPEGEQRREPAEFAQAAQLCGATATYVNQPGIFFWIDSKMLYETALSQVRSLMNDDSWTKAYSEGQSMTLNQAVASAIQSLKERDSSQTRSEKIKLG